MEIILCIHGEFYYDMMQKLRIEKKKNNKKRQKTTLQIDAKGTELVRLVDCLCKPVLVSVLFVAFIH